MLQRRRNMMTSSPETTTATSSPISGSIAPVTVAGSSSVGESIPGLSRDNSIDDHDDQCDFELVANLETSMIVKGNKNSTKCKQKYIDEWSRVYDSPPIISQSSIIVVGIMLFVMSKVFGSYIILLLSYIVSVFVPYCYRINDSAVERRKLYKRFCREKTNLPDNFLNIRDYVNLQESYWENERAMLLCTSVMTPKDIGSVPIQAVACYCHGYTDHASFGKRIEYQRLVKAGIAVVTIEYEGHGRSDGTLGLIPNWDYLISDVANFFQQTVSKNQLLRNKPTFLIGESMGGAISFDVYNKLPTLFAGVVFVCPMCKVKDDMLPPQWIIDLIQLLIGPQGTMSQFGSLPISPSKRIETLSTRVPELMHHIRTSPTCFSGRKPRLITARELILTTKRISATLHKFNAPFLVVHGKEDKVTDPKLSQTLYDEACSQDKSIQLYEGLWHNMTTGESNENMDMIFNDIISWILQRS